MTDILSLIYFRKEESRSCEAPHSMCTDMTVQNVRGHNDRRGTIEAQFNYASSGLQYHRRSDMDGGDCSAYSISICSFPVSFSSLPFSRSITFYPLALAFFSTDEIIREICSKKKSCNIVRNAGVKFRFFFFFF